MTIIDVNRRLITTAIIYIYSPQMTIIYSVTEKSTPYVNHLLSLKKGKQVQMGYIYNIETLT